MVQQAEVKGPNKRQGPEKQNKVQKTQGLNTRMGLNVLHMVQCRTEAETKEDTDNVHKLGQQDRLKTTQRQVKLIKVELMIKTKL